MQKNTTKRKQKTPKPPFQKSGGFTETQKCHSTSNQSNEKVMMISNKTKIIYKE